LSRESSEQVCVPSEDRSGNVHQYVEHRTRSWGRADARDLAASLDLEGEAREPGVGADLHLITGAEAVQVAAVQLEE